MTNKRSEASMQRNKLSLQRCWRTDGSRASACDWRIAAGREGNEIVNWKLAADKGQRNNQGKTSFILEIQ